ncbi:MAG: ATP-binding protein [Candidatus Omnitrophota bacterium]
MINRKFIKRKPGIFKLKATGIRRKLVAVICLSVFFVTCIGVGLGYYGAIHLVHNRAVSEQAQTTALIAGFLKHLLEEEVHLFEAQAITDVIKEAIRESNRRFDDYSASDLERFQAQMDADWLVGSPESSLVAQYTQNIAARRLQKLLSADESMAELLITDKYGNLVIASSKTTDFYQADESWWQNAVAGKSGEVFISEYSYDESLQQWGVVFATAIRDADGQVLGVAKALVNTSVLFGPLKSFKLGRTGHSFVINEHGVLLFHEGSIVEYKEFFTPQQLKELLSGRKQGIFFYSPIEKSKFFVNAAIVKTPSFVRQDGEWIVVVSQGADEIFLTLNALIFQGVILLIFLIILLIPVGYVFGSRFVKPLEELARASGHVARGDLDYQFNIKTGDEIEGLAEAFKAMVAKIKQNQKVILSEKTYLNNIITSMSDALFIFDLEGYIKDVNAEALELLGYQRSELVGNLASTFFEATELFLKNVEYERRGQQGLIKNIDMTWKAKSGELIPVYFSMSFLYEEGVLSAEGEGGNKELKAVIGVARDMRDIKKLIRDLEHSKSELETLSLGLEKKIEERTEKLAKMQKATLNILSDMNETQKELKKANTELKKLDELKSGFVSHVSHELRTPLAVIRESIEIVKDSTVGAVNSEQVDFLETAQRNVDRLVRLINAILDLQKLESGRVEFIFDYYDIGQLVREVYKSYSLLVQDKGLAFDIKVEDGLPLIKFDRDKMVQVLSNLLSNALKFTQNGGITLSVYQDNNCVRVAVKDTGDGIKKENIPKLFGKFVQLANKIGGSGLGLVLCKEIVEAHKGKIWIESEFGAGTTVSFILPLEERRV